MAYIRQEDKKKLAPEIKKVLKKYAMKGSIAINNHSTLVVNLKEGALDLIGDHGSDYDRDYIQVNTYYCVEWANSPTIKTFYDELIKAMKGADWYDKTDAMIDYFDIAYYININVGQWNKPYVLNA